ncbi:hypothetical protein SRABI128_05901 [Microbacterium sp. Bi128]|nr:hypothetical protein SRABI128_05901 [Microbacterium sp. Bi128]
MTTPEPPVSAWAGAIAASGMSAPTIAAARALDSADMDNGRADMAIS